MGLDVKDFKYDVEDWKKHSDDYDIRYPREERIEALSKALDNAETSAEKLRLNYLLAKFYLSIGEENSGLTHYFQANDLLEYVAENGLMNFKDFYRYRDKLEDLDWFVSKSDWFKW